MGELEWHGDQVQARIRAEMRRRIEYCTLLVWDRAKELLNVEGTGIFDDSEKKAAKKAKIQAKREARKARLGIAKATRNTEARRIKRLKDFARTHNEAHKLGIDLGKIKKLRVTKGGKLSNRKAPRKKKEDS